MESRSFLSNKTVALNDFKRSSPVGRVLGLTESTTVIENEEKKVEADILLWQGDDLKRPSETFMRFLASGKPILHVSSIMSDTETANTIEPYLLGADRNKRLKGYGQQKPQVVKAPRLSHSSSRKPLLSNWAVLVCMPPTAERRRLLRILESGGAFVKHRNATALANNFFLRKVVPPPTNHQQQDKSATTILHFIIISDKGGGADAATNFTICEYNHIQRAVLDPQAHCYIVPAGFLEHVLLNAFNDPNKDSYLDYSMREEAFQWSSATLSKIRHSLGSSNNYQPDRGPQLKTLIDRVLTEQNEAIANFDDADSRNGGGPVNDLYSTPSFLDDLYEWWTRYIAAKPALDEARSANREQFRQYFVQLLTVVNAQYAMASGTTVESIAQHIFGLDANLSLLDKSNLMLQNAKNCLPKLPKTTKDNKTVLQTAFRLLIPTFFDTPDNSKNRVHFIETLDNVCTAWVTEKDYSLFSVMLDHLQDVFIDATIPEGVKTAMKCMHFHIYLILALDFVAILHRFRTQGWPTSPPITTTGSSSHGRAADDAAASTPPSMAPPPSTDMPPPPPPPEAAAAVNGTSSTAVDPDMPLILHYLLKGGGPENVQARLASVVHKFRELFIIINEQRVRVAQSLDEATGGGDTGTASNGGASNTVNGAAPHTTNGGSAASLADFSSPHVVSLLMFVAQIVSLICEALALWYLLPTRLQAQIPKVKPWISPVPDKQHNTAASSSTSVTATATINSSVLNDAANDPTRMNLVACVAHAFLENGDALRNEQYLKQPATCDSLLTHILSSKVKYIMARAMLEKFFQHEFSIPPTTLTLSELAKNVLRLPNVEGHRQQQHAGGGSVLYADTHTPLMWYAMRLPTTNSSSTFSSNDAENDAAANSMPTNKPAAVSLGDIIEMVSDHAEGIAIVLRKSGQNALHLAAMANIDTFNSLVDVGLNFARDPLIQALGTSDNEGLTPLHYAFTKWFVHDAEALKKFRTTVGQFADLKRHANHPLALNLIIVQHLFLAHVSLFVKPVLVNTGWEFSVKFDDVCDNRLSLIYFRSRFQSKEDESLLIGLPFIKQEGLAMVPESLSKKKLDKNLCALAERLIRQMPVAFPKAVNSYDLQVCSSLAYVFCSNDERQWVCRALECLRLINLDVGKAELQ